MYDVQEYRYLINKIAEQAKLGISSLNYLFPLDDNLARAFARLGYTVNTRIFDDSHTTSSYSEIIWRYIEEEGVYTYEDLKNNGRFVEKYDSCDELEGIKANEAKGISLEVQKRLILAGEWTLMYAKFNFVIQPELKKEFGEMYTICINSVEGVTFLCKKDKDNM